MPDRQQAITAAGIMQQFAGTRTPVDPCKAVFPDGAQHWSDTMRDRMSGRLTPAGVLIPIIERPKQLTVLLTERAEDLKHHAGQVSFPGGRMEDPDEDIGTTALRETHEEVGIPPDAVSIAGFIRTMPTVTGYAVTPVVGLITGNPVLELDRSEVEYVFEVPLPFLLDRDNDLMVERELHGVSIPMLEFSWERERIWGATAYMICEFRKTLLNQ